MNTSVSSSTLRHRFNPINPPQYEEENEPFPLPTISDESVPLYQTRLGKSKYIEQSSIENTDFTNKRIKTQGALNSFDQEYNAENVHNVHTAHNVHHVHNNMDILNEINQEGFVINSGFTRNDEDINEPFINPSPPNLAFSGSQYFNSRMNNVNNVNNANSANNINDMNNMNNINYVMNSMNTANMNMQEQPEQEQEVATQPIRVNAMAETTRVSVHRTQQSTKRSEQREKKVEVFNTLPLDHSFSNFDINLSLEKNRSHSRIRPFRQNANEQLYLEAPFIVYIDRGMKEPTHKTKTEKLHKKENRKYIRFVGKPESKNEIIRCDPSLIPEENCNMYSLPNSKNEPRTYRFYESVNTKVIKYRLYFAVQSLTANLPEERKQPQPDGEQHQESAGPRRSHHFVNQSAFFLGAVALDAEYNDAPTALHLPLFLHPQLFITPNGHWSLRNNNLSEPAFSEEEKNDILVFWLLREWEAGRKLLHPTLSRAVNAYCWEPTTNKKIPHNLEYECKEHGHLFESRFAMNAKEDIHFQGHSLYVVFHNGQVNPEQLVRPNRLLEPCASADNAPLYGSNTREYQQLEQRVDFIRLSKNLSPQAFEDLLVNNWCEDHFNRECIVLSPA